MNLLLHKKKIFLSIPVLIVIGVVVFVVVNLFVNKGKLNLPTSQLLKKEAKVSLKTEYKNPFDKETQYVNPFQEYKNPFVVNR